MEHKCNRIKLPLDSLWSAMLRQLVGSSLTCWTGKTIPQCSSCIRWTTSSLGLLRISGSQA